MDLTQTGLTVTGNAGLAASAHVPADAVASQLLTMPTYRIPANQAEYACAAFTVDLPPPAGGAGRRSRRQVVAAEAVMDRSTAAGRMVHPYLLSFRSKEGVWDKFATAPGS